ncbi:ATP-binding protein [Aurantimonas marina]|uniref:ATP-binding protein n=1 Tax=Aurantimonas marina TaxID=2780508 RepID=UPI0019CF99CC|nr:ATP-binding protein [Aurantimonas marina]
MGTDESMGDKKMVGGGETIDGAPTKRFFVQMLPRDIELDDAILDLVDNSVDGAMRSKREELETTRPFEGYRCDLQMDGDSFRLIDNCGGIPNAYLGPAFRLGRPSIELDGDLPTIGMYGIGMKRAIFKMARDATVTSRSSERAVRVRYDPDWLDPESPDWLLQIDDIEDNGERGVEIAVTDLLPETAKRFRDDTFLDALRTKLGQHFAYIMGRGFSVTLNGHPVSPETVQLIFSEQVKPYDFEAQANGVEIKVTLGFFRNLTRQSELEEATDPDEGEGVAADAAGITVICNERVVVISDRTTITGWGIASTPRYHPQFRAISGLIIFSALDAKRLPISTTKRDLDTDSDVFLPARNAAMEGIRLFVAFTNKWKGSEEDTDTFLTTGKRVEARSIKLAASEDGKIVRGSPYEAKVYRPTLPTPPSANTKRRVAFSKDRAEIERLGAELLDDAKAKPGDVGAAAWDRVANELVKK